MWSVCRIILEYKGEYKEDIIMEVIKTGNKPICKFCLKEVDEVLKGKGIGTICFDCLKDVNKMSENELEKPEDHMRVD